MIKPNLIKEREELLSCNISQSYANFSEFLRKRTGKRRFVAPAHRFLEFFEECDKQWSEIPDFRTLISTFNDQFVQKNMPVLAWLVKTHQILVDDITKQILISQAAIQERFVAFGNKPPSILQEYLIFLNERQRQRQSKPSSVRTVLQPIIDLYYHYGLKGSQTPTQAQIDSYLTKNKGHLTAIISFVHYLNTYRQFNLTYRRIAKPTLDKITYKVVEDKERQKFEKQFILLAMLERPLNDRQKIQWINNGIKYFHRFFINIKTLSDVVIKPCKEYESLILVEYGGNLFPLPKF